MTPTDLTNTGLPELATKIKQAHRAVRDAAKNIVTQAILAGAGLNDAKAKLAHGEFLVWLKDHCELSERTAYNYMLIAANRNKFALDANLTLAQALRQIRGNGNADDSGKGGPVGLYDRAQATLMKKLGGLLPGDVEDAAKRTIAELEAAVAATKRPAPTT